jgi:hypothetical protein
MQVKQRLCRFIVDNRKCPVRLALTLDTMNVMYMTKKLKWNTHVQSLANN